MPPFLVHSCKIEEEWGWNMNKKINFSYILTNLFFHGFTAAIYGFGIYSLIERNYSSGTAGVCLALACILGFVLQPVLSNVSDNSKSFGPFEVAIGCTVVNTVFSFLNFLITENSIWLSITFILNCAFYIATEPFINAFTGKFEEVGIRVNFSFVRSFGSLSYAVFSYVFGKLTLVYSHYAVSFLMTVCGICLLINLILLRKTYSQLDKKETQVETENTSTSYAEFIKNNKSYIILIIYLMLIYLGYVCFDNFMLLVVEEVGGNSGDLGSILSFKGVFEIIALFALYPVIVKKIHVESTLKIAAIMYSVKAIVQFLSPNLFALYAAQVLQAFSFALMYPGMVDYVNKYMAPTEITRGQALTTMSYTFSSILSSFVCGYIAEALGVKMLELIAVIISIIGTVGFVYCLNKNKRSSNSI